MRTHLCLIAALLVLLSASVAFSEAEESGASDAAQPLPVVNLDLRGVDVQKALDALFQGTGQRYTLEPNVTGSVSFHVINMSFENAVVALARIARLDYRKEDGVWKFSPAPAPGIPGPPGPTGAAPDSGAPRGIPDVIPGPAGPPGPILQPPGIPLPPGIAGVPGMPQPTGMMNIRPTSPSVGSHRTFDIALDQASLYEAIRQLMEIAGQEYVMDLGAFPSGPRISAKMRRVTLDNALDILARSCNLEVQKAGPTYVIKLRQAPGMGTPGPGGPPGDVWTPCHKCHKPMAPDWNYCPWCGQPAAGTRPTSPRPG